MNPSVAATPGGGGGATTGLATRPWRQRGSTTSLEPTPTAAEIHAPTTPTPLAAGMQGQPPLTPPSPFVNPTIADAHANAKPDQRIVNAAATSARHDALDVTPRTLNLREEVALGSPEAVRRLTEWGLVWPRQPNAVTPRAAADQRGHSEVEAAPRHHRTTHSPTQRGRPPYPPG